MENKTLLRTQEEIIVMKTFAHLCFLAGEPYAIKALELRHSIEQMTFAQRSLIGRREYLLIRDYSLPMLAMVLPPSWRDAVKRLIIECIDTELNHCHIGQHIVSHQTRMMWRKTLERFKQSIREDEWIAEWMDDEFGKVR